MIQNHLMGNLEIIFALHQLAARCGDLLIYLMLPTVVNAESRVVVRFWI